MPLITSKYRAPSWLKGRHMQTIVPALFRRVIGVEVQRERISTPDGDFLDVDWGRKGHKRLAILSHGYEGSSRQPYILGMTKALNESGWDTLGWNYRGCSGEINNKVRFYHADSSDDLAWLIDLALNTCHYRQIVLIGFSLGGSMTLKYLGENHGHLPVEITHAATFSVPGDLYSCVEELSATPFQKGVYHQRFLLSVKSKLAKKITQFPDLLGHLDLGKIHSIEDFDNQFTAPLCGFKNARDYYKKCSCAQYIPEIRIPTLIVNAQNDPLLHPNSHPMQECRRNKRVFLEMTGDGGHVGFVHTDLHHNHWTDMRAIEFLETG